ncbi:MAG TPA: OsmC family protein [Propionicimonas sp.]|nr:OsmC family protein [Propionicimonas sp.]
MTESNLRSVSLARTGPYTFEVVNARGTRLVLGEGDTSHFTPIELLLAATAACSAMDVDHITSRRAEPEAFDVSVSAPKLHDELGNHLGELELDFRVTFPAGPDGDRARDMLARSLAQSRDRLCTVSRTVQLPTAVSYFIDGEAVGQEAVG